jgi:hypothetical protein
MNNINLGSVLLGGLLAGLVLNVGEVLFNDVVLGTQMRDFFARYGMPEPGGAFLIAAVTLTFAVGILLVFLYALIRSRLGPGMKTALVAGLILWFAVYIYSGVVNALMFGLPIKVMALGIVWGLLEYLVAAMAGGWVYKES